MTFTGCITIANLYMRKKNPRLQFCVLLTASSSANEQLQIRTFRVQRTKNEW